MKYCKLRVVCLIAALLSALALGFAGCTYTYSGGGESDYFYDGAESYTVGGASVQAEISSVEADWIGGEISIAYASADCVRIDEESEEEIPEEWRLRYLVEDGALKIKFAASGRWKFGKFAKRLTLTLPQELRLDELSINSVSADVSATALSVGKLNINSVSGGAELGFVNLPQSASFDAVSGNISLTVPQGSAFGLKLDTVSGRVSSSLPYEKQGDNYSFGGGKTIFYVNSVSGSVTVGAA